MTWRQVSGSFGPRITKTDMAIGAMEPKATAT